MISRQYLKTKCFGYELQELCSGMYVLVDEIYNTRHVNPATMQNHSLKADFGIANITTTTIETISPPVFPLITMKSRLSEGLRASAPFPIEISHTKACISLVKGPYIWRNRYFAVAFQFHPALYIFITEKNSLYLFVNCWG